MSALRWLRSGVSKLATRFTNTEFYADLENGKREPVATNIDPDPGPIENPDPGGDGGGGQNPGGDQSGGDDGGNDQGTGGDIGNPSGSVTTTTGGAPVITRKNHSEDIFAQKGVEFSITYVSDRDCTFIAKKGFKKGQVETVSDDGREFTITFTPPLSMPGDSYYIGCKAEVYGDDGQPSSTLIYDIAHIGKEPSDIIRIGRGTGQEILQNALEDSSVGYFSGCTVVVEPGYYDDDRDYLHIGQWAASDVIPNGMRGELVPKVVFQADAVTPFQDADGNDEIQYIQRTSKYTTIISRQPYKAIIDRKNFQRSDIEILGNYRAESFTGSTGYREVFGIAVKGFACRNTTYNSRMEKVDSCKITDCSNMQSITTGQYMEQTGEPAFFSDGGMIATRSVRNCTIESINALANNRAGLFISGGGYFHPGQYLDSTMYCRFKNIMLTHGCFQPFSQHISQTFLGYGGRNNDLINCWAIDSKFFISGYRSHPTEDRVVSVNDHFSFQITNASSEQFNLRRFLAINDSRGGVKLDQGDANTFEGRTTISESVFWGKAAGISQNGIMDIRGFGELSNITVGKVEDAPFYVVHAEFVLSSEGVLVLNPTWDYAYPQDPTLFGQPFNLFENSADDKYCLISDNPTNAKMNALDNSLFIDRQNTKSSGAQYVGRIDPGTNIANFGAGCTNIFADELRTETEYLDDDDTIYDGRSGERYINSYSRECWESWQEERRGWSTFVDDVEYTGAVGWCEQEGISPTDYINREGTSPDHPTNCPFIDDIYGKVVGSDVKIWWRPVCAPYRDTITGYDIYIDRIRVAENQPKEATQATLSNVESGTRVFEIIAKDPTFGDSGFSREVRLTIP